MMNFFYLILLNYERNMILKINDTVVIAVIIQKIMTA